MIVPGMYVVSSKPPLDWLALYPTERYVPSTTGQHPRFTGGIVLTVKRDHGYLLHGHHYVVNAVCVLDAVTCRVGWVQERWVIAL